MLPRPKPEQESLMTYGKRLARQNMPTSVQNRYRKQKGLFAVKGHSEVTVVFDLNGPCKGPINKVVELASEMAYDAFAKGNLNLAEKIIRRLERLSNK